MATEEAHLKTVDIVYRYEARDISARPLPRDSDAALRRLSEGNADFAALLDHAKDEAGIQRIIPVDPRDLGFASDTAGVAKQLPFAAVLGCSDARVPIELIFNEGPNDLFVVRVAGNGLGLNDLPGSRAAYGVYILETRELWPPRAGDVNGIGLAPAPCGPMAIGPRPVA